MGEMHYNYIMCSKKRKLSEEHKRKISNANRGRKRPDLAEYNRTRTDLIGRKPWNKGLRGIKTGPPKGTKPWNTGRKLSEEHRRKISEGRKGKGKRPKIPEDAIYEDVRNGWALQKWSKAVIKRDGVCAACGSKDNLEAHHILPRKKFPHKMYDVKNGITLCHECHLKTDTYGYRLDCKR